MTESRPDDPRRERLLYRALAEFSDACDIPSLTPSCPFYQEMADGTPVCGEECKDVLGDDLSHAAQPEKLSLGGEFAAVRVSHRPRPRRKPHGDRVAFDARQIYLTEYERDISTWGMTALINGLKFQLGWMSIDPNDPPRIERVQGIIAELQRRGAAADQIIRQGLFRHITSALIWHIRNTLRTGTDDDLGWMALLRGMASDAGIELADLAGDDADTMLDRVMKLVSPALTAWTLHADLEDLLEHRVRHSPEELRELASSELPPRDYDAVWLVDRFTATFLEGWNRRSLQREWRYIHSQCAGPCPPASMRERVVDVNGLALVLAELGAEHLEKREGDKSNPESTGLIRVDQFYPLAVDALQRGDREEAVSIYRMMYKVRPEDRQVTNNLGFCLLPDDPHEAARLFEKAIEGSVPGPLMAMTYFNLSLAHFMSGDRRRAREALRLGRESDSTEFTGYMWDLSKLADRQWAMVPITGSLNGYGEDLEDFFDESDSDSAAQ